MVETGIHADVLRLTTGMLIGDTLRLGTSTYPITDPATGEIIGEAPEATPTDVADAVAAARAAQPAWGATPITERADLLRAIGRGLAARRDDLAPLVAAETGCLLSAAPGIIDRAVSRFERFAALIIEQQPIRHPVAAQTSPGGTLLTVGETAARPVGVVAAIAPFNFPMIGAASKIAPAIAMGNTVVFKPAPQDPLQILAFGAICREVGVPAGVINIVTGSRVEVGQELVASPDVDMVSFTGSTKAGSEIYRQGADHMRRHLLELGGKGALIVRADADLDAAAEALSRVWRYYSGQWCAAPTRAIVHRDIHDALVERLELIGRALRVGDQRDPDADLGPIISEPQRDRIEATVARAIADGAMEVLGHPARGGMPHGYFVAPALLTGCRPEMTVVQEEVFGPVLAVLPYSDDEEAIRLANDSRYGLTNYLFSADATRAWEMAAQLRSGSVLINTATPRDDMPFGGVGMSGLGRDNGQFALDAYSEPQGVLLATTPGTTA